jgi:hypothetical protein
MWRESKSLHLMIRNDRKPSLRSSPMHLMHCVSVSNRRESELLTTTPAGKFDTLPRVASCEQIMFFVLSPFL